MTIPNVINSGKWELCYSPWLGYVNVLRVTSFFKEVADFCILQSLFLNKQLRMKFYLFLIHPKACHFQLLKWKAAHTGIRWENEYNQVPQNRKKDQQRHTVQWIMFLVEECLVHSSFCLSLFQLHTSQAFLSNQQPPTSKEIDIKWDYMYISTHVINFANIYPVTTYKMKQQHHAVEALIVFKHNM